MRAFPRIFPTLLASLAAGLPLTALGASSGGAPTGEGVDEAIEDLARQVSRVQEGRASREGRVSRAKEIREEREPAAVSAVGGAAGVDQASVDEASANEASANEADDAEPASTEPGASDSNAAGSGAAGSVSFADLAEPDRASLARATQDKLPTGLRVVLQPTPGAPWVSVCSAFDAGASLDSKDRPGVARALAEIFREGGYRSPSQDYAALVKQRGGSSQLEFSHGSTVYCTTLPAAELPLALWVAAGRYTVGALTEKELSETKQRLALSGEALRADVRGGRSPERLRRMALSGLAEASLPLVPNEAELDRLEVADLRRLHKSAYGAARSVVAVSGGFDPDKIDALLKQHLGHVRAGEPSDKKPLTFTRQTTERFSMAEDADAKHPAAWYGWVLPEGSDREALRLGLFLLTSSKSRLRTKLEQQKVASELRLSFDAPSGPTLARIDVQGRGSQSLGFIEKELESEIHQLALRGPTQEELSWAVREQREARAQSLASAEDRARELARGVLEGRTVEQVLAPLDPEAKPAEISPEAVRRAVATHLPRKLRSVVEIYPKGWQDPWQAPMPAYHLVNPGESLGLIAKNYKITVAALVKMNEGLDPKKPIYPGEKLRVPRQPKSKEPEPLQHTVKRGDTLSGLAAKYGVGVRDITEANGMNPKQAILTGEVLKIPRVKKTDAASSSKVDAPSAPVSRSHEVKSGETLSGIAKKYGIGAVELARANGISQKALVKVGQVLKLPDEAREGGGSSKASSGATKATPAPAKSHKVKSGETLSGIAKKYGLTVSELAAANGMTKNSPLQAGRELVIPGK